MVLANYPVRDGRVANGVGLDTPDGGADAPLADAGMPRFGALPDSGDA